MGLGCQSSDLGIREGIGLVGGASNGLEADGPGNPGPMGDGGCN